MRMNQFLETVWLQIETVWLQIETFVAVKKCRIVILILNAVTIWPSMQQFIYNNPYETIRYKY